MNLYDKHPSVDQSVFVAPNATVVGDVSIAYKSNIWYGAVVRGEKRVGFHPFAADWQQEAVCRCALVRIASAQYSCAPLRSLIRLAQVTKARWTLADTQTSRTAQW
jgi:hypothetical protein